MSSSCSFSEFGGHLNYPRVGSVGSGSFRAEGSGVRASHGYSVGMGKGGGLQSHVGLGLGSGLGVGRDARGSRFGLGLASSGSGGGASAGGSRFSLGLASGSGGGSRFAFGWSSGGGAGAGRGVWTGGSATIASTNEKLELQTLNDRLATYLDKVKRLETANHELEEKLRGFKANKVQVSYDMKAFQNQLQPLRDQITDLLKDCSHLTLSIDNTKLAADNFRIKYENEFAVRKVVEEDTAALKALRKEYDLTNSALKQDYQILLKDRDTLQSTHQEEVLSLRGQVAGTLTVSFKETDAVDLSRRLADLRSEYESIVERNHRETETWYTKKLALNITGTEKITEVTVTRSVEVATSQGQILTLHTELDELLLKKSYQEQRLLDVQGQKQMQLLSLSRLVGGLEGELAAVRESALQQAQQYQLLLSTKVQLEKEITAYKTLLEAAGDLSKIAGLNVPPLSTQKSEMSMTSEASSGVSSDAGGAVVVTEGSADLQASSANIAGEAGGAAVVTEGSADLQTSSASVAVEETSFDHLRYDTNNQSTTGDGEDRDEVAVKAVKTKLSISSPYEAFLD